ncbi:MAG: hypothetical protein ACXV3B_12255, partial [Ilumatobacteraceae bacterium]
YGYVVVNADVYQRLQRAVAIVTDRFYDTQGRQPFDQTELARVIRDDDITEVDLVLGLVDLSVVLVTMLEKHAGMTAEEVLAQIAGRYRPPEA